MVYNPPCLAEEYEGRKLSVDSCMIVTRFKCPKVSGCVDACRDNCEAQEVISKGSSHQQFAEPRIGSFILGKVGGNTARE